jgi:trehalose transport system substrate-binding protein
MEKTYQTTDWTIQQRDEFRTRLAEMGIDHRWSANSATVTIELSGTRPDLPQVLEHLDTVFWQVGHQPGAAWDSPREQITPRHRKTSTTSSTGRDNVAQGGAGLPRALWIPIVAALAGAAVWLGLNDGPPKLRALAGFAAAIGALVVLCLALALMGRRGEGLGALVWLLAAILLIFYPMIGDAQGLHVGWGWPVNTWRDLLDKKTVLIGVLTDKRVEHDQSCDQYGDCTPDDHYWITVGGHEWPVSRATHDVLEHGEVVEVGYRPYTRFVEYVAYGPGLSATRGKHELRVAVSLAPSERQVFEQQILPQFKRETGLDVTFVQMEPDTLLEVLKDQTGSPFDLLAVDNDQIGQLAHEGLVQDLSQARDLIPPEVIPSMLSLTKVDGHTLFLPFRPNVMITYYAQRDLGLVGVAAPKTWPQLLTVAAQLDRNGKPIELQGALGPPSATQLDEFLLQAGGDPLALDSPQSLQALRFISQLGSYLDDHSAKAQFDTVNQDLLKGDVSLAPNWTFGVSEIVVKHGRRDIAAYPGWAGPAGLAHVLGGDVLAIPKLAERRGPALQLAKYLMSQPVQATLASQLSWPSMRGDAYANVAPELRPYWQAIDDAMTHATARPTLACWHEVEPVLSDTWNSIAQEHENPDTVAKRSADKIRRLCH